VSPLRYAVVGALLGCAAAVMACLASRRFVDRYLAEGVEGFGLSCSATRVLPVAAAMALFGGFAGWSSESLRVAVLGVACTSVFYVVALVDLQVRRIPNLLVGVVVGLAVVQGLVLGWPTLLASGLGGLLGGGVFAVLYVLGRGAMGLGDVKFVAASGLLIGYPLIVAAMLWGIFLGGAAALLLLVFRKAGRKDPMAYGPYLAMGAWLVWAARLLA